MGPPSYSAREIGVEVPAARSTHRAAHRVESAADTELGSDVAQGSPVVPGGEAVLPDAGAEELLTELLGGLGKRDRDDSGTTRICVAHIRNFSRAQSSEFADFVARFAKLMSRSGRDHHVEFTSDPSDEPIHYHMLGTAYLMTIEGFDMWELFMTISPPDSSWTLWQSSGPVRVLRQPRPGQQQVFPWRDQR